MFEHLCIKTEEPGTGIVDNVVEEIKNTFKPLNLKFNVFYGVLWTRSGMTLVQNLIYISYDVAGIYDEVQEKFLELHNDSSAHDIFQKKLLSQFWCAMRHSCPNVSMLSFRILVPFAFTYLAEGG